MHAIGSYFVVFFFGVESSDFSHRFGQKLRIRLFVSRGNHHGFMLHFHCSVSRVCVTTSGRGRQAAKGASAAFPLLFGPANMASRHGGPLQVYIHHNLHRICGCGLKIHAFILASHIFLRTTLFNHIVDFVEFNSNPGFVQMTLHICSLYPKFLANLYPKFSLLAFRRCSFQLVFQVQVQPVRPRSLGKCPSSRLRRTSLTARLLFPLLGL